MFGGAAMDQAVGWANSARAWHYKKQEMEKSDELQRAYAHDAPGLVRSGYEAANMNPMLAYSNSAASEAISASGVDSNGPQGSTSAMQAVQLRQQKELNDSTVALNEKTGISNMTNAIAAMKNADTNSARSAIEMDNQTRKTDAEIAKLISSTDVDKETKKKLIQETALTSHKATSAKFTAHIDEIRDRLLTNTEKVVKDKTNWLTNWL